MYKNGRVYVCLSKWYILKLALDNKISQHEFINSSPDPVFMGELLSTALWTGEGVGSF